MSTVSSLKRSAKSSPVSARLSPHASLGGSPRPAARAPKASRVYAIGDIHGRLDLLERLLDAIARDSIDAPERKVLVTLGDVIDRGPDSAGVVARLLNLHTQVPFDDFELHFLMGNHEQMMEAFLQGEKGNRPWLDNGGVQTLESYDAFELDHDLKSYRALARDRVPASHRRFLKDLELMHREGDYLFVHAGVRPGVALKAQVAEDVLWIRGRFLNAHDDFGAVVVHGHSPVEIPDVLANRIAIDTRAWLSGTLTCLVLQDDERRFLST